MNSIRFTRLRIKLQFLKACHLPKYKVSAIRGGMGQMLLAQNCIADRNCERCDFVNSCIVENIMYAPLKMQTSSSSSRKESMGYVIDCTDRKLDYAAGDSLLFEYTLFGDTISYIMPIIYALTLLGNAGLGEDRAVFQILEISNRKRKFILKDGNIQMKNILIETLGEYVAERMKYQKGTGECLRIKLKSPCAVKYRGEFLKEFDEHSLVLSMLQKLHMYQLYEGKEVVKKYWEEEEFPVVRGQFVKLVTVPRYSSTQDRKMYLKGIQGELYLERCSEKVQKLLYAMEILHFGKNTRFGFGKVQVDDNTGRFT